MYQAVAMVVVNQWEVVVVLVVAWQVSGPG
jgi:hypothetical protein